MLYFICCGRNNGVIKEGSILRWMMCALERLVLSRNEKGNKCRNRRKKYRFFLFHTDSETMGDRNVYCLSLIGCYRLRAHYVDSGRGQTGSSLGRVGTVSTINHGYNVNITRQETRCSCNLRSRLNAFKASLVTLLRVPYLGGFPF